MRRRRSLILLRPQVALVLTLLLGIGIFSIYSTVKKHNDEAAAAEKAAQEAKIREGEFVNPEELGPTAVPFSTAKTEWKKGEMPHLYQTDPTWASKPYGGGTVLKNAYGPTALNMVYVYLTGKTNFDPGTLAAWADERNFAPTGATEWAFMTNGAAELGLKGTNFKPTRSALIKVLKTGAPIIMSVGPGDFTSSGHFIVLKSIDDRGLVEVYDPNSPFNSARLWSVTDLSIQSSNAWSFSV